MEQVKEIQAEAGESERREGGRGMPLFVWVLVAVVIYVLSSGPVGKLMEKGVIPDCAAVTAIYAPMNWLAGWVRPVGRFLGWYIHDVWQIPLGVDT